MESEVKVQAKASKEKEVKVQSPKRGLRNKLMQKQGKRLETRAHAISGKEAQVSAQTRANFFKIIIISSYSSSLFFLLL